ncbi:hypothetical protein C8J57DRAFT_1476125 [Mycena rebaudengoi]|nr:hypothetical protein C8J57DRAFT_1476125 [Mycena rebaudengoi]
MAHAKHTPSSRSLRSDIRTQISELDARILTLDASLAAARRERENLQFRLDEYRYPILSLPFEITSEIFINFLPIYPLRPPLTGRLSPALLGQICHQWRDIAFGTPLLWRAIKIDLQSASSLNAQLNVLTTWLSRSKDCPLSLSFQIAGGFTFPKLPLFTAALISQSERWEHINLIIPFHALRWLDCPFPLLRDLTFGPNGASTTERDIVLFGDAPQLKSVVVGVLFNPSRVVLPWSQLTSINAVAIELDAAAGILRQATALVKFTCTLWGYRTVVPAAMPPLIHLESLIIYGDGGRRFPHKRLLDAVTTPALRHLSICESDLGDEPISDITSLLSRSHCSLDSLHVTHSRRCRANYSAAFPSIKVIKVFKRAEDDSDDDTDEDTDDGDD